MKRNILVQKSKYTVMFVVMSIFLALAFFAYYSEKLKTIELIKIIAKQDSIVAPYYKKSALEFPIKLTEKGSENNKIKIPIVMYHYVEYVKDDGDLIRKRLDIAPSQFEGHLRSLRNANYETYFVKDVPEILNGSIHYSTQSAILTFDDGYEDFYTDVFPLLKKYHMRATLYIIYDFIGRKGFLNEKQIRELIESDLVEIGSHTLDHIYLKQAPKKFADKQIIHSKYNFETQFGIKIYSFAYPYGVFNSDNIESVKKAGYTAAVSVISGVMQSKDNLFFLSRIRPELFTPQTMIQTIEKMNK